MFILQHRSVISENTFSDHGYFSVQCFLSSDSEVVLMNKLNSVNNHNNRGGCPCARNETSMANRSFTEPEM